MVTCYLSLKGKGSPTSAFKIKQNLRKVSKFFHDLWPTSSARPHLFSNLTMYLQSFSDTFTSFRNLPRSVPNFQCQTLPALQSWQYFCRVSQMHLGLSIIHVFSHFSFWFRWSSYPVAAFPLKFISSTPSLGKCVLNAPIPHILPGFCLFLCLVKTIPQTCSTKFITLLDLPVWLSFSQTHALRKWCVSLSPHWTTRTVRTQKLFLFDPMHCVQYETLVGNLDAKKTEWMQRADYYICCRSGYFKNSRLFCVWVKIEYQT